MARCYAPPPPWATSYALGCGFCFGGCVTVPWASGVVFPPLVVRVLSAGRAVLGVGHPMVPLRKPTWLPLVALGRYRVAWRWITGRHSMGCLRRSAARVHLAVQAMPRHGAKAHDW